MQFANKNREKIYRHLYIHDGETLLIKDIAAETGITRQTVSKHIKWLIRRELIKRTGKTFSIVPV